VGINKPCDGSDDNSTYFNRELWSVDGFVCGRRNRVEMSVMSRLFATFSSNRNLEANSGLESDRGDASFIPDIYLYAISRCFMTCVLTPAV